MDGPTDSSDNIPTQLAVTIDSQLFIDILARLASTWGLEAVIDIATSEIRDTPDSQPKTNPRDQVIEKVDALVDLSYYIYDSILRCGCNPDRYSQLVVEFVRCRHEEIPTEIIEMTDSKAKFLLKMVISECIEGLQTEFEPDEIPNELVRIPLSPHYQPKGNARPGRDPTNWIQFTLIGVLGSPELSKIYDIAFREVHRANMSKAVPDADGVPRFIYKEIGGEKKVDKPATFRKADLHSVLQDLI